MRALKTDIIKSILRMACTYALNENTPVVIHRNLLERLGQLAILPSDIEITEEDVLHMRADRHRPAGYEEGRILYYLHGGGFMLLSKNTHRGLVARLATQFRSEALVVNYRHSPEHNFPIPVEDAASGYEWLLMNGYHPEDIIVGGDSAGGGLTLSMLLTMRERGIPMPAGVFLLSPWADLSGSGESMQTKADIDIMIKPTGVEKFSAIYLDGTDPRDPVASPVFADLAGLPPIMIQVGDEEVLLDDSVRLAEKIKNSGGDVRLEIWPGMFHVWQALAPHMNESVEAIAEIGNFADEVLI